MLDIHANYDIAFRASVRCGNMEVTKLLLDARADIHSMYEDALEFCIYHDDTKSVDMLLDYGANIHAIDIESISLYMKKHIEKRIHKTTS